MARSCRRPASISISSASTTRKLRAAKPDALIMHPGPMNRGVEIGSEVADDIDRSLIRHQVEMGVAVRMACLEILTGDLGNGPPVPHREVVAARSRGS